MNLYGCRHFNNSKATLSSVCWKKPDNLCECDLFFLFYKKSLKFSLKTNVNVKNASSSTLNKRIKTHKKGLRCKMCFYLSFKVLLLSCCKFFKNVIKNEGKVHSPDTNSPFPSLICIFNLCFIFITCQQLKKNYIKNLCKQPKNLL